MDMQNYETFKQILEEELKTFLPNHFKVVDFSIRTVTKANTVRDGVQIRVDNNNIGPVIYLDFLYEMYQETGDITNVLDEILAIASQPAPGRIQQMRFDLSKDGLSQKIVFGFLNTEMNEEFLKTHPHREWHDISIAYRCVNNSDDGLISSFWITQEIAEQADLQEKDMYKLALVNTPNLLPEHVDIEQNYFSNEMVVVGTSFIMYPDLLSEISKYYYDDDLYLIPSSRHFMLAFPKYIGSEHVNEIVNQIRRDEDFRKDEDFLSSSVYYYNRKSNEVTLACTGSLLEAGA